MSTGSAARAWGGEAESDTGTFLWLSYSARPLLPCQHRLDVVVVRHTLHVNLKPTHLANVAANKHIGGLGTPNTSPCASSSSRACKASTGEPRRALLASFLEIQVLNLSAQNLPAHRLAAAVSKSLLAVLPLPSSSAGIDDAAPSAPVAASSGHELWLLEMYQDPPHWRGCPLKALVAVLITSLFPDTNLICSATCASSQTHAGGAVRFEGDPPMAQELFVAAIHKVRAFFPLLHSLCALSRGCYSEPRCASARSFLAGMFGPKSRSADPSRLRIKKKEDWIEWEHCAQYLRRLRMLSK
ncbi:hypothetical protein DFH08DRAFT_963504 [Mycena albidolilacea]|uniref:Uncharacterized protein n=1 Tax=Mycena albidolilacea TaxID=1033008 RepID=A0AAD6ZV85_9AGAR|nr:hypothetical protein DFH08DRAFT_963504 [Mycena albidolilacea]